MPVGGSQIPALPPPTVQSGGARLWQAAGNVQNPVLRALAKTGAGIARVADVGAEALAPRAASVIPGSEENTKEQNKANEEKFEKRTQLADQQQATAQKPEVAEEQGELKGKLQAERDADVANRQDKTLSDEDKRAADRAAESDKARIQSEAAATTRQQEQFGQQEKLEQQREAAAEQRVQQGLPAKDEAANDRGYQFNSTQLEKIRTPIDALSTRMSTLTQNTNFHTPQADALLAPEILSVVAGGSGSGLRMNQAELDRIMGGATKWTQLQTALNKWSTDPQHATFTDEQRNQMRQIVGAIQSKVTAQQTILEDGEQKLIDAKDRTEQRQVVANTRKLIDAVNNGKKLIRKNGEIQVAQ